MTGGSTVDARASRCRCARPARRRARMLVDGGGAALERRSGDLPRRERRRSMHAPSGRKLGYGELVDAAAKLPVPEKVALKDPKRLQADRHAAPRLDTPARSTARAKFGIDARVPGMKFAVVAHCAGVRRQARARRRSQGEGGARRAPGRAPRRRGGGRRPTTLGARSRASRRSPSSGTPARTPSSATADIVAQLARRRRSSPAWSRASDGRRRQGAGSGAATQGRSRLRAALSRARDDGADELHRARDAGRLRHLGRHAGPGACAGGGREGHGLPPEKVHIHNHLLGGGFGRRLEYDGIDARRADRQAGATAR